MISDSSEILIKGKNVFVGYYKNDELYNQSVIDQWFHTGDVGLYQDGKYIYKDRSKDLIIKGGINIVPAEVEEILYMEKEIHEAAVIGIADDVHGEEVIAAVALKDSSEDTVAVKNRLYELLSRHLSSYKHPVDIIFLETLPKTLSGKLKGERLETKLKMSIIEDLKELSKSLKEKFLEGEASIVREKLVSDKTEFVLNTDMFSQNHLINVAREYHPNFKVISEELDNYMGLAQEENGFVIMDPLDGTHNFLFGLPMWGFSYSLFDSSNLALESYIGIPMLNILLAYKNDQIICHFTDAQYAPKEINLDYTDKPLSNMMIAYDNQFNKDPNIIRTFNLLVDNVFTLRISGSAVFDISMLIFGRLDARIWHYTEPYDVAPVFAFKKIWQCCKFNFWKRSQING